MSEDNGAVPRPMITYIKENINDKPLVGVEIGVLAGENAESILQMLNMETLYLVDPYRPYVEQQPGWNGLVDPRSKLEEAQKCVAPWGDKVKFIINNSDFAAEVIPNELDFVYIDGSHECRQVARDIVTYYPKVRRLGILGGHDFGPRVLGVVAAVSNFCVVNNIPLNYQNDDWWIVKTPPIIGGPLNRAQT